MVKFLSASVLRSNGEQGRFVCEASVMGLPEGLLPGVIETDLGNGCPLHLDHSISDEDGIFTGVAYRQSGVARLWFSLIDRRDLRFYLHIDGGQSARVSGAGQIELGCTEDHKEGREALSDYR